MRCRYDGGSKALEAADAFGEGLPGILRKVVLLGV
jgi:hypothetical protein